jgi:hypothetical protein
MGVRPGVLPLVSDPHQRCGTALYCSCPSTTGSTTYSASAIDMGRPWQHRIAHTACAPAAAAAVAACDRSHTSLVVLHAATSLPP